MFVCKQSFDEMHSLVESGRRNPIREAIWINRGEECLIMLRLF